MKEEMKEKAFKMGSFLEGYREQTQKIQSMPDNAPSKRPEEILDLFRNLKIKTMTLFEIATELHITKTDAKRLADELVNKKLVILSDAPTEGFLVTLTSEGEARIK